MTLVVVVVAVVGCKKEGVVSNIEHSSGSFKHEFGGEMRYDKIIRDGSELIIY
jgi:hypothetical protein